MRTNQFQTNEKTSCVDEAPVSRARAHCVRSAEPAKPEIRPKTKTEIEMKTETEIKAEERQRDQKRAKIKTQERNKGKNPTTETN